jgi:hypothetical protein
MAVARQKLLELLLIGMAHDGRAPGARLAED